MNEFVNMGKRSIELPAGCKDLIDVLQPAKRHALDNLTISLAEGGLADLAKHLANLLEQGKKTKNLGITWHELNYLHLVNEGLFLTALLVVHDNTHREQAVRAVFAVAGLAPIRDEAVNGWSVRVLGYPLPAGASNIEELISDLLRKGYGLAENVRLEFAFWEDETS